MFCKITVLSHINSLSVQLHASTLDADSTKALHKCNHNLNSGLQANVKRRCDSITVHVITQKPITLKSAECSPVYMPKSAEPLTTLTDVCSGFLQLLQTFLHFLQTNVVTPHSLSTFRIHQMRSYCDAE